jgi:hypothetical protein
MLSSDNLCKSNSSDYTSPIKAAAQEHKKRSFNKTETNALLCFKWLSVVPVSWDALIQKQKEKEKQCEGRV